MEIDGINRGNKAKYLSNGHRRVYRKKKNPYSKMISTKKSDCTGIKNKVQGKRIISMDKLQSYTNDLTVYASKCTGNVTLVEQERDGLASVLLGECSHCDESIAFETSAKIKGPRGYSRWETNLASIWGQMVTGEGHTQLEETMSIMGAPVMSKTSFVTTERQIGEFWKDELDKFIVEAGAEEKKLAEERGDYHEGAWSSLLTVCWRWRQFSLSNST